MHLQSTGDQRICLARLRSYEGHVKTADAENEREEGVAAAVFFLYNDFIPIPVHLWENVNKTGESRKVGLYRHTMSTVSVSC